MVFAGPSLFCAGLLLLFRPADGVCPGDGPECSASSQGAASSGVNLLQFNNAVRSEVVAEAAAGASAGSYNLCAGTYNVGGYTCGSPAGQDDTKVFFPCNQKAPGALPVVAYAHGMGGRGEIDAAGDAFREVVSLGIVVIVPDTDGYDPARCTSKTEYKDLLRALQVSEGSPSLHKALPRVDWSRQAVWGYSMGGKTAPRAVKNFPDGRIKALVASHGARECDGVAVPSLLLTGARDSSSSPPEVMRAQFDSVQGEHKVYLNLEGAYHDEPLASGRLNVWVARFLACHLGLGSHCDSIYGSARDVCRDQTYARDGCLVRGAPPSGGPADCTASGADPYASGSKVDCCIPLVDCLGNHNADGQWFYKCLPTCGGATPPAPSPPPSCSGEGVDPYAVGKKVDCCSPLSECLGDHGTGGTWFYKCLATCP
mmetsp:Transcript_5390/g.10988  ORF Transcript_5390/g.10988 Transcript_5390/m.10988 type:complete len:427 (-) Transcript_5390:222-1502(-)